MHNKIGFLTGVGGNSTGLGDYVGICDSANVPVAIAVNDNVNGIADIINLPNSSVDHQMLYRVVRSNDEKYAVPDYSVSPAIAAQKYYNLIEPLIHPLVKEHSSRIWIALGNELDKERCDWLGLWGIESAKIWNGNGYKVALFGFASGTPGENGWKQAGMLEFLRYAAAHGNSVAVNLHEYSYNNDLLNLYPDLIGGFQHLFKICDDNVIGRPKVWIGEWGWHYDWVPVASGGMPALLDVANMYAQYKTILGAALWTLQNWSNPIYDRVNTYIKPITISNTNYNFTNFSRQNELIVKPDYKDDSESEGMVAYGCDVSRWQGKIDWSKLTSKPFKFVFIKATQGSIYVDDQFSRNWYESKRYGIYRGMYHFYDTEIDPILQANHFADVFLEHSDWDLLPVVDMEDRDSVSSTERDEVHSFLLKFEELTGIKPMIYTSPGWWNSVVGATTWSKEYPLWVAHWGVSRPTLPSGWSSYVFWQYVIANIDSSFGVASSRLDINQFNGTVEELIAYVNSLHKPVEDKHQAVVALIPQEVDEEYWSQISRHAFRDHKRDITASHLSAEAIYLSGDSSSYIKIISPEYQSQKNAVQYLGGKGYNLELVPFTPSDTPNPEPDPEPPTTGESIDINSFIFADPRAWRVVKYRDPNGNESQEDIQDMDLGNGIFVRRKNNLGEWWTRDGKLLHDTSPAPAESGPESGISRVYTIYKDGGVGAYKHPAKLRIGEFWIESTNHYVQFRRKDNCKNLLTNSGDTKNRCTLIKHEKNYKFNTYGQNLVIDEVIWLETGQETQIYGKHNGVSIGWIGWEAPWGKSEIVELHFDRGVMTKEPNRYCQF